MTPRQYRNALRRLSLSQGRAAALLGYSIKQSNRYANGGASIPAPVAVLLRLLARGDISEEQIVAARKS